VRRSNWNRLLSVLILSAILISGTRARGDNVDPKARQLLGEVIAAYKALPAYTDHGEFRVEMRVNDRPQTRIEPSSVALERPNKVALTADSVQLWDDGATLALAIRPTKRYHIVTAPKEVTLGTITEGPIGSMLLGGVGGRPVFMVLNLLLAPDPAAYFLEGGAGLRLGDDSQIEGKAMRTLVVDPDQGPDYLLRIDPDSKLIREIEHVVDAKQLESLAPAGTKLSDARIAWTSGAISTEAPKPELFAFHAPAGFSKVADLEPIAPGADRAKRPLDALIGKAAPEFTLTVLDGEGKTKRLRKEDLAGKVVVLDFWATWCPPCLAELPELQKMIDAYAKSGKGVLVIAVSQDRQPDDGSAPRTLVEKTLKEKKLSLAEGPVSRVALDPSQALGELFHVEGLPTVFVLDAKGVVQSVHEGYTDDAVDQLTTEINTLLEGKSLVNQPAEGSGKKAAAQQQ
jgi:thiol-disulfide isomerase/thioredoxin